MKIFDSESFMPFNFINNMKLLEKKDFIQEEILWLERFLMCVQEHLSQRKSEGISLCQNENIKALIADVVANIEMLNHYARPFDKAVINVLSKIIRETCHYLAKLAGGRAFLAGNIIEMLWTFEIINLIYLWS
jgi:hypothetical protein